MRWLKEKLIITKLSDEFIPFTSLFLTTCTFEGLLELDTTGLEDGTLLLGTLLLLSDLFTGIRTGFDDGGLFPRIFFGLSGTFFTEDCLGLTELDLLDFGTSVFYDGRVLALIVVAAVVWVSLELDFMLCQCEIICLI